MLVVLSSAARERAVYPLEERLRRMRLARLAKRLRQAYTWYHVRQQRRGWGWGWRSDRVYVWQLPRAFKAIAAKARTELRRIFVCIQPRKRS